MIRVLFGYYSGVSPLLSILCPPSTWAALSRLFLRYVTPTVAAMLVTGVYVTIDGIFVGHILGRDGLAA